MLFRLKLKALHPTYFRVKTENIQLTFLKIFCWVLFATTLVGLWLNTKTETPAPAPRRNAGKRDTSLTWGWGGGGDACYASQPLTLTCCKLYLTKNAQGQGPIQTIGVLSNKE